MQDIFLLIGKSFLSKETHQLHTFQLELIEIQQI